MRCALQQVVWQQGALVAPQHLQHQATYHDARLHTRLNAALPYNHGVLHIAFDALALERGEVHSTAGAVILADGTYLRWDEATGDAGPMVLPLPPLGTATADGAPLALCLVLPPWRPHEANVAIGDAHPEPQPQCRFRAQAVPLPELTQNQTPAVDVLVAMPQAYLAWGHTLAAHAPALQVAAVIAGPNGSPQFDPTFLPVALRLRVHGHLMAQLQALGARAGAAEQGLSEQLGDPNALACGPQARRLGALRALRLHLAEVLHNPGITRARPTGPSWLEPLPWR